jgi:hypothetical protein
MQLNFKQITPLNLLFGCSLVALGALVLVIFPWLFLKTYIASDEEVKSWDKGTAADEAMMLSWKGQRTDYVQYLRESHRSVAGWGTVFGVCCLGGGLFCLKPIFKKSEPAANQTPQGTEITPAKPPSHCPYCREAIQWTANIGKCKCRTW